MSEAIEAPIAPATPLQTTPLAARHPAAQLCSYAGVQTVRVFDSTQAELGALITGCGVFDQGWRTVLHITGGDRVRWLNGMVTNTVKDLANGHWNYTFLLNAQGKIQGDAELYALPDSLLLVTDHDQSAHLAAHLDRFIIMDEVELAADGALADATTAIGVAGPSAADLLTRLHLLTGDLPHGAFLTHADLQVARTGPSRYTLRGAIPVIQALWPRLLEAGAVPAGADALESLRILEGRPRFGVDIQQRTLAQETGQTQALNFSKGCYLGQEIVERVRSRANVHRAVRSFALDGAMPAPATALASTGDAASTAGELTSITSVSLPSLTGIYAIGTVRSEAATAPLAYSGGVARVLDRPPLPPV